jgi:hypothetical protein
MLSPGGAYQRIVKRAPQDFAIGKPRERILAGEPVELDLGLPHLRQVGGKASKAEEPAELVVDRLA